MTDFFKMLSAGFNRYLAWRQAAAEEAVLRAMTDRELSDIGLSRSEIHAAVTRRPVERLVSAAVVRTLPVRAGASAADAFEVRKAA